MSVLLHRFAPNLAITAVLTLNLTFTAAQVMWVETSELEQSVLSGNDQASAGSTSSAQGAWERLHMTCVLTNCQLLSG